ncbi:hypothetical protein MXB_632 [Myxobolus squamalis]|nr:hypothetical protein MXB_632 [Myxobolus squamalis]
MNFSYGSALNNKTQPVNLCFSGCGFLISYHIGVIYCLTEYGGDIYCNSNRIYGSSGGALIGVSILAGISTNKMLEIALGVVYMIKSKKLGIFDPFLRISQLIKIYLENNLPENIHELCTDRLFINLTEFPSRKSFLVSKYHCKSDLIDAIVCTTFIPIIFGLIPPIFRGKRYIDGGLSDNLPRHQIQYFRQSSIEEELCLKKDNKFCSDIHGVKSCGESGEGDICPREKDSQSSIRIEFMNMCFGINFKNVYRVLSAFIFPSAQHVVQSCNDGYLDTKKYLIAYDIARNTEKFLNNCSLANNSSSQVTRIFDDEFSKDFELNSPFYIFS